MRLSTSMMYELGMRSVQRPQADQLELQQKISTGRRVAKPSDDPIAAAAVIGLNQAKSVNQQYATNAANAQAMLSLEVDALADVTRVLQDMKTLLVRANNPVLQNQDRATIAAEVRVLYDELLGISNRTDGNDQYLFSGYQGATPPFAESSPGVVEFAGDEGQRTLQIGPQRRVAVSDSGDEVFRRMRGGNGTFVTRADDLNSGTGAVQPGTVRNLTAWESSPSHDFTLRFHNDGAVPPSITYDIVRHTVPGDVGVSMLTNAAPGAGPYARTYVSGNTIDLQRLATDPPAAPTWDAGIQLDITGAPGAGDTFDIRRSETKDVFTTAYELRERLGNAMPIGGAARALYDSEMNEISSSLDSAMSHILTIRASTGVRSRELDGAQSTSQDLGLRYEEDLARLQDLDYAEALSQLAQKQFGLEAAQKSYVAVTSLKLFDFIK